MHRALGGAPVARVLHSPRLGAGLIRRLPWSAGFLLMQSVCGFACGFAAAAKPQRPHNKFLLQKRNKEKELVRPLSRLQQKKINAGREAKPLAFNT